MEEEQPIATIVYRLDTIEKQLNDMKSLLTESALQKKELDGMRNDIVVLEARVNNLYKEVAQIKSERVSKYKTIVDYVVKFFAGCILTFIAIKIGLK